MTITNGNKDCILLLDFGIGCTITNMSLAKQIMFNCMQPKWSEKKPVELNSFSNNIVKTLRIWKRPVSYNNWKIPKGKTRVVADGFRTILGRDLFDQLGITISQKPGPKHEVKTIEPPCAIKQSLAKDFPELISRIRKSNDHTVNKKFHKNYRVIGEKYQFTFNRR